MSDLTERLRAIAVDYIEHLGGKWNHKKRIEWEAAEEIDRLEAELKHTKDDATEFYAANKTLEVSCAKAELRVVELSGENERLESVNKWAELDVAELIDDFGVHPLYWNGVWQACLNETNVPVEHFKSENECRTWCDIENKDATETPTIKIVEQAETIRALRMKLHGVTDEDIAETMPPEGGR